ncbi:hypothetical protein scyTo_0025077, partial [Scyliorhinus torazame]|nr:hypothetical protein [Scyliorhinus torazame]
GKLAAYFLGKLDTASPHVQELACQCYVLLPGLGTGFAQGMKYAESWAQQLHCLLATLHGLVEQLYEEAETGECQSSAFCHRAVELERVGRK